MRFHASGVEGPVGLTSLPGAPHFKAIGNTR